MRRLLVLTGCLVCALPAMAQPRGPGGAMDGVYGPRDERRSTGLRDVLRTPQASAYDGQVTAAQTDPPPTPIRHLSPQQRAELREQLRRDQNESRGVRQ